MVSWRSICGARFLVNIKFERKDRHNLSRPSPMVVPVFLCVLVRTTPSFPVTHEPVNELKCLNNL